MPVLELIGYFIVASCILIVAPGPDIIFLISQSVLKGSRAGICTALGLASGNLAHTFIAAIGISTLIINSPIAFSTIKIIGAGYLLYLAYDAIKSNSSLTPDNSNRPYDESLFLRGFLMNLLNPKVSLFFLAFLPQFITNQDENIIFQMVFLGITFTLLVIVIFGSIGFLTGRMNYQIIKNQFSFEYFNWLIAFVFVCLSINLLLGFI